MMNSIEIDELLRSNPITQKYYVGIFPCDALPKKLLKGGEFVIVNFCSKSSIGCHWLLISMLRNGKDLEIFDSSGMPTHIFNGSILKFLRRHGKRRFVWNRMQLQAENSSTCGQFCVLYAYFKSVGINLKNFQKMFNKKPHLEKNDDIVNKMVREMFF